MTSLQKQEETNWNRACRLLLEGGRHVLISFLENFWTSNHYSSLDAFLATHKTKLTSPPASRHIHPPQINILFPASGDTITDKWDITLAAAVVHNCVPHKTPGQKASLTDIRDLRNNVHGHGQMGMTDAVFTTTWADVNNTLAQAAVNFHLTPTQSDLKVKSDRIKKEVIVDGDELRKELKAWYLSDILQGQTDIREDIRQGTIEQKEATTGINAEISKAAKEQKDARSDIKAEVRKVTKAQKEATIDIKAEMRKGTKEQKEASYEIKAEIRKGTKEQKEASSEIKADIRKGTKEQKEASSEIKADIRKGTKEQKEANSEIKAEIRKVTDVQKEASSEIKAEIRTVTKEQKEANSGIKTVMDQLKEIKTGQEHILQKVTLAQSSKAHGTVTPDTYKSQLLTGTRPKCSIPQPRSRKKSNISSSRLPIKKVVDSKEKVRSKVFTSSVTNQRVNFEQQPRTLFPVATDQRVDIEPPSGTQFPLATSQPVESEPPSMTQFPLATNQPVESEPPSGTQFPLATNQPVESEPPSGTQFPLATNQPVESEQQPGTKLPPELQRLQSDLVELYRTHHVMSPLVVHSSSSQADIDAIYAKPHLVLVDHRALTKESSKEENIAYADIFQRNVDRCHQMYISGDAGVGKTSLCKHLVSSWCLAHSQEPVTDDQEMVPIMKQFDFLFYVTLRHAKDQFKINEMIVTQLLDQTLKQSSIKDKSREQFLEEFFEQYSKRCLIVLDGLDEWTAPRDSALPSVSNGLPGRSLLMNYTIVTTTRPWKLADLTLQDTEVDKKIELRGVEKVENFGEKLIEIYNKHHNGNKKYADFERQLELEGLSKMKDTPILLKQLICLWYNGHSFGKSKTDVYTNMVELLFERAERRENVSEFKVQGNYFEVDSGETHTCFKKGGTCEKYKTVLLKLGKLAFETMFSCDNNTQLVFESSEVGKNNIHKKDIDTCVTVGVLTRSIVPDMTRHRVSLSFLHKTFHEYFAALYMSVYPSDISDLETRVSQKCKSVSSMFDMRDMFQFLSGMCPSVMKSMSGCLVEAINNDEEVQYERHNFYRGYKVHNKISSMILSFCKESSDNVHGPLYLPVPDIDIDHHTFFNDKKATLMQCLQHYPSQLRSISLKHYSQWSADASIQCTEKSPNQIDLFNYSNLSSVAVIFHDVSQIVLTINTDHLTDLYLFKVSLSSILPTIKAAKSLITLVLLYVQLTDLKGCNERHHMACCNCRDNNSGMKCRYEINLSEHRRLKDLELDDISVGSVTLSPSIMKITLNEIYLLTHDGMCSLMSSLSNAHSLENIDMTSVKCVDHACGIQCRCEINLSEHNRLEHLTLDDISAGSVTLSPSIRFITLNKISLLTHDGMCSLMSSLSNAHSLEKIDLTSVKCLDHANGIECRCEINLSELSRLEYLSLDDISVGSVTLSPFISEITLNKINLLTHDGMCSLMSSLSNAHSLNFFYLTSVRCLDHASGIDCRCEINLSEHSRLEGLGLKDISVGSVTLSPSIRYITLNKINLLTHDGMCSLMSSLSNAHSLENIDLISVKCIDYACGIECRCEINLSEHSRLEFLTLCAISVGSVTLSPSIMKITLNKINLLTHDGMCSLMSSLSNHHSLKKINLRSVKCLDHASGIDCRCEINFSEHSRLEDLTLDDISVGSVTMSPSISIIELNMINLLTHDGMCSLMSSLSNAHSLENISLTSVKFVDHAGGIQCRCEINLSEHSRLKGLTLDDILVGSVTLSPSIRGITLNKINLLTHDGMCSLMSSLSNHHSLTQINLISVKCLDHASGIECRCEINLSDHSRLWGLTLDDISVGSVALSPSIGYLRLDKINLLTHDGMCSLMSSLSNAHSLKFFYLTSVRCLDHASGIECRCEINLSEHSGLWCPTLADISVGSVTLSPFIREITLNKINLLTHDGMCSLMSSLSNAHSLKFFYLTSVRCLDHASWIDCRCEINLSEHSRLESLGLKDISVGSVTLSPSIGYITLNKINLLTHDGMCSLMSSLSNAHSLENIDLISVKCIDYACGIECRCDINLSEHSRLEYLTLGAVSVGSVTLSPSIREITLNKINLLTHDRMCSLMSSLSNAHSLEKIHLTSVKCLDYACWIECRCEINLSEHSRLDNLTLDDVSVGSVILSPSIRDITLNKIYLLTHDRICSLMSSLSNAHSLEKINLISVKCIDYACWIECRCDINLSEHSRLEYLTLGDVSVGSVTLSPSIREITLNKINLLTHDRMCSLMSSLSNAHSLEKIHLISVKCLDYACWKECRCEINLSEHSRLEYLTLDDVSVGFVTLSPSIRGITLNKIKLLTHDGMCSLMSSLSNAHSLEKIHLISVKCLDYACWKECRCEINFSEHSRLEYLTLDDVSVGFVTLSPSIRGITLNKIKLLTHDGMCSLMSSLSNAHSLENIDLTSVKCLDHASGIECRFEVNLSEHSRVWYLMLDDISVGSVTLSPSIRDSTLNEINLLTLDDEMCSLMSSLYNEDSLQIIDLESSE